MMCSDMGVVLLLHFPSVSSGALNSTRDCSRDSRRERNGGHVPLRALQQCPPPSSDMQRALAARGRVFSLWPGKIYYYSRSGTKAGGWTSGAKWCWYRRCGRLGESWFAPAVMVQVWDG